MLSGNHFYYRTIRRNVIAFGNIFKEITMARYEKDTNNELHHIIVPLSYAGKENFLTRILDNPDLHKPVQTVLPRMSFEMTSLTYDTTRKLSSFNNNFNLSGSSTSMSQQYSGVPYDIGFQLNIYVRNVEDGTQIVEQILPYFNPDYTLAMSFVDSMNIVRNVPVILEDITYNPQYEGSADTTVRILTWTLNFKMKTYFFGPINTVKYIKNSSVDMKYDLARSGDIVEIYVVPEENNTTYMMGETVYQGARSVQFAVNTAEVVDWVPSNNLLRAKIISGAFKPGANVYGAISLASHNVTTVSAISNTFIRVEETINPPTANAYDDFGFTTTIYESPNL